MAIQQGGPHGERDRGMNLKIYSKRMWTCAMMCMGWGLALNCVMVLKVVACHKGAPAQLCTRLVPTSRVGPGVTVAMSTLPLHPICI